MPKSDGANPRKSGAILFVSISTARHAQDRFVMTLEGSRAPRAHPSAWQNSTTVYFVVRQFVALDGILAPRSEWATKVRQ